ncbi:hypothetical protein WME75_21745 [Sorangium sp. So ce1014]|uniref:hypothetical protein n=1 Tax=Sorangium sp. So ce1014 TaxID=3133326 RepID=UPI003F5DBD27
MVPLFIQWDRSSKGRWVHCQDEDRRHMPGKGIMQCTSARFELLRLSPRLLTDDVESCSGSTGARRDEAADSATPRPLHASPTTDRNSVPRAAHPDAGERSWLARWLS